MEHLKLLCVVTILCAVLNEYEAALSCDSALRRIRPNLFKHCSCKYSEWTDWEQVPNTIGPDQSGRCSSGKAYQETRRQYSIGGSCQDIVETHSICVPSQVERLALLLNLGKRGSSKLSQLMAQLQALFREEQTRNEEKSVDRFMQLMTQQASAQKRCNEGSICQEYTTPRGKRSNDEPAKSEKVEEMPHFDPIPFSVQEHGTRFRRQANSCRPGDNQHVLFALDTSGSIVQADFSKMKKTVAELTALFCKDIEVSVLTFNHEFHLEFCFNCYDGNNVGRIQAEQAMKNMPYRSGWTHTAGAAKCICNKLLQPDCGIEITDNTCIDVIFITDGASNDPNLKICDEVKCLHNHFLRLNTYSLGIGNYQDQQFRDELKCIQQSDNHMSMFWFDNFDDFDAGLQEIYNNGLYGLTCLDTNKPTPTGG